MATRSLPPCLRLFRPSLLPMYLRMCALAQPRRARPRPLGRVTAQSPVQSVQPRICRSGPGSLPGGTWRPRSRAQCRSIVDSLVGRRILEQRASIAPSLHSPMCHYVTHRFPRAVTCLQSTATVAIAGCVSRACRLSLRPGSISLRSSRLQQSLTTLFNVTRPGGHASNRAKHPPPPRLQPCRRSIWANPSPLTQHT